MQLQLYQRIWNVNNSVYNLTFANNSAKAERDFERNSSASLMAFQIIKMYDYILVLHISLRASKIIISVTEIMNELDL